MKALARLIAVSSAVMLGIAAASVETQAVPQSPAYQLVTDGVTSGGESCTDGHARVARSVIGEPIANDVATASYKLSEGHFVTQHQLLLLLPHQAPAINPVITPTAVTTQTLTGTKAPDTSLWLNGVQIVPLNADMAWSYILSLVQGTNVLNLLTKDAVGNASATITTAILLDTTPPTTPVVTNDGVFTLNLTQLHATWTASDPETSIQEYEYRIGATPTGSEVIPPTSVSTATSVTKTGLTLVQGQIYYLAVRARNAVNLWSEWGVSDGIYANASTPVISVFSPADASKFLHGNTISLSATSTDADGDALEYQFSSNGTVKRAWAALSTHEWLTAASDIGLKTVKVEVRDGHGGVASREQELYIFRKPVSPSP